MNDSIEHHVKNVRHYTGLGRDLGAHEREYFCTDVNAVCAAALRYAALSREHDSTITEQV